MRRSFRLCRFLVAAALLVVVGCVPYRKESFKGPAAISKSGSLFPLYAFNFSPALSLHEDGERTYSFRGLPSQRMSLLFFVEPFDIHEVDRLKSLMTILNVDLRDDSGAVLCAGSGRLLESASGVSEKGPNDHWTLGSSAVDGYFWRAACNDMRLRHRHSYRLTVKISDADPRTPQVSIRPVLYSADQP
jgi:hypothetical protein